MNIPNNTRERLLEQAARIFVEHGYHKSTTREICIAANTNITSIHYHFKDKKGLYRAIFEGIKNGVPVINGNLLQQSAHSALLEIYSQILMPVIDNEFDTSPHIKNISKYMHALLTRERFEPTNLVDDLITEMAKSIHDQLDNFICSKFNLQKPDLEVKRISFTLMGIGFSLIHPKNIVSIIAPELIEKESIKFMLNRLADFGCAIIESEYKRRNIK
jgi:AcrR family transcriptional regulator